MRVVERDLPRPGPTPRRPQGDARRDRRRRAHRRRRLRRRDLSAGRAGRPRAHHARRPDRRRSRRQDGRGHPRGQEPGRRLPPARGLHRRRLVPRHSARSGSAARPSARSSRWPFSATSGCSSWSRKRARPSRGGDSGPIESGAVAEIVERCAWAKVEVVTADAREASVRMTLNLGHTIGHGIEAAAGYRSILHGEAVAYGLRGAFAIALAMGLTTAERARARESAPRPARARRGAAGGHPRGRPGARGDRQEARPGPPELGAADRVRAWSSGRTCRRRRSRPGWRPRFASHPGDARSAAGASSIGGGAR